MMRSTRSLKIEDGKLKIENRKSVGRTLWRSILYPLFSVIFLVPGCLKQTTPVGAVSRSPLIVDQAMQQRNWSRSVVRFQNGETPAWPTGFVLEHNPDAPKWTPVLTDGPLFLANVFAMPVGYAFTPAWTRVIYTTDVVPPTYTAVPPMPIVK